MVTGAANLQLSEAIREHESLLIGLATRLAGNPDDARDLVQDTYERALKRSEQFASGTNLRAWLVTILKNLFIDECRKRKRAPALTSLDPEPNLAARESEAPPWWTEITTEQMAAAIARLDDDFRVVYELKEIEKKSYDEIAATLGIRKATVGTRIMRARRKLKTILEEMMA